MTVLTQVTRQRFMQRELELARNVAQRAVDSSSMEIDSPKDLVVRDIIPSEDLESGDDNGWNGTDNAWAQDWNAGGTANAFNQAYQIDSDSNADGKIIGILAFSFNHAGVVTSGVRFGMGTSGAQGIKQEIHTEQAETDEESRGVLATDVVYGPKEDGSIDHYITAAEDGKRVVYSGVVAEPVETTITQPVNPLLNQGQ